MTDRYPGYPAAAQPVTTVDAGRLWAGGAATAGVAALIAIAGILVARGLFDVPVLAPRKAGAWGDASTAGYAVAAGAGALLATAVMHVLVLFAPSPKRFFAWIVVLATTLATLAPFATDAPLDSTLVTAGLNLLIGVAIGSLVAGTARTAVRVSLRTPFAPRG